MVHKCTHDFHCTFHLIVVVVVVVVVVATSGLIIIYFRKSINFCYISLTKQHIDIIVITIIMIVHRRLLLSRHSSARDHCIYSKHITLPST